jgi:hypothetical protein
VPRDQLLWFRFDAPLDATSLRERGVVQLLDLATGETVGVDIEVASADPWLLQLHPGGRACLRAGGRYQVLIQAGSLLGGGLRDTAGRRLATPVRRTFTAGDSFLGFQALASDPGPREIRWWRGRPTVLAVRCSEPVAPTPAPLRLYAGLLAGAGNRVVVPLRRAQSRDPLLVCMATLEPLAEGLYTLEIGELRSRLTGEIAPGWTTVFEVARTRVMDVELPDPFFLDPGKPLNLAIRATIEGRGLHGAEHLQDGRTGADGGAPAWLQTDGWVDASLPEIRWRWPVPVQVGLLVIDTDDQRWGGRRVLGRYRLHALVLQAEAPAAQQWVWREVHRETHATGDHLIRLDQAVWTRELRLSHASARPGNLQSLANPVVYEIAIHPDPGYRPRHCSTTRYIDAGASGVRAVRLEYLGIHDSSRWPLSRGALVLYRGFDDPPGDGWPLSAPHTTMPYGHLGPTWRYLEITAGEAAGESVAVWDLRAIRLHLERLGGH